MQITKKIFHMYISYTCLLGIVISFSKGFLLCKKDWTLFQGMCYIVGNKTSHDYLTWPEAEKKCQRIGNNGHLVSIHSQSQQNFIRSLQRRRESIPMWIGLNDLGTEANYKWTDESTYNYSNWASGQPDNYFRKEDCIHLVVGTGTWNDNNCHENKYSYICKAYNESENQGGKYKTPSVDKKGITKVATTFAVSTTPTQGSSSQSPSMNNIIIIIGTVAAVVVAIITAMLIAGCFLFGRKQGEENRRDIRNIRNAAYQSDNRYIRELPPVPEYDVGYQLPIECLQHGSPIDALNMYDNSSNEVPDESPYVIMPEELLSKRSYSEIA